MSSSVSFTSATGKDVLLVSGVRYRVAHHDPYAWNGEGSNITRVGTFVESERADYVDVGGYVHRSRYVFQDDLGDIFTVLQRDLDCVDRGMSIGNGHDEPSCVLIGGESVS